MVVVGVIRLRDGDDGNGTNETSDVVHVAVGIVPGDATIHPQHLVDAEIVVKHTLQILAAEAWVALLHRAQQALFCGDESALAVDVDAPAFQHHAMAAGKLRSPARQLQQLRRLQGKLVVKLPVVVLRPGVKPPVGDGDRI